MTEYVIKQSYEENCFTYYHYSDKIGLKMTDVFLTDDELSEYISDSLIHEYIHKILNELFNNTVSKLFDGIEEYFRNRLLHEKQITEYNKRVKDIDQLETYQTYIARKGFSVFLCYYGITQEDIIQAKKICNERDKNNIKECKHCSFTNIAENKYAFLCLDCGYLDIKDK